jgi:hypothetical protein
MWGWNFRGMVSVNLLNEGSAGTRAPEGTALNMSSAEMDRRTNSKAAAIPLWIGLIAGLAALLMATGAVIALVRPAMLVAPGDDINGAVRVYAGYLVSRNLAVAAMLLLALGWRARQMLNILVLLVAWIQILDAVIDGFEGRWPIVPGVAVFGVVFLLASARLSGYPFWRAEAWRS